MFVQLKQWFLVSLVLSGIALGFSAFADDPPEQFHIEAARGYMQAGRWDYAGYEWRMALEKNPKSLDANLGLAEMLLNSGQTTEAIRHLSAARKTMKKMPLDMIYGQALEQKGDFVRASKLYQQIIRQSGLDPEPFRRMIAIHEKLPAKEQKLQKAFMAKLATEASSKGNAALKAGRYVVAAKYFAISSEYNPKISDLNNYGTTLVLLGRYREADLQFEKLKKAQAKWEYYANTAFAALGVGDAYEAASYMERAISLCNDGLKKPLLYNDLGYIYETQKKWAKARSAYERAIELNPAFTKAKMNLAYVYQKEQSYDEAIRVYNEILQRDRNNTKVMNRMGFVYELAHEEKKAAATYKRATKANPREKDAFYNLALLYRKMGETKSADDAFRKMMSIEFNQMEARGAAGKPARNLTVEELNSQIRLLDFADVFFVEPG